MSRGLLFSWTQCTIWGEYLTTFIRDNMQQVSPVISERCRTPQHCWRMTQERQQTRIRNFWMDQTTHNHYKMMEDMMKLVASCDSSTVSYCPGMQNPVMWPREYLQYQHQDWNKDYQDQLSSRLSLGGTSKCSWDQDILTRYQLQYQYTKNTVSRLKHASRLQSLAPVLLLCTV